jgi:hypothetical protein
MDCEAPDAFYRAEEGGKTVLWRRIGRQQVEFFNASIFGRREKGAVPVSEGERSMWGGSWFPCEGATGGCSGVAATDSQSRIASGLTQGGRQLVRLVGPTSYLG